MKPVKQKVKKQDAATTEIEYALGSYEVISFGYDGGGLSNFMRDVERTKTTVGVRIERNVSMAPDMGSITVHQKTTYVLPGQEDKEPRLLLGLETKMTFMIRIKSGMIDRQQDNALIPAQLISRLSYETYASTRGTLFALAGIGNIGQFVHVLPLAKDEAMDENAFVQVPLS